MLSGRGGRRLQWPFASQSLPLSSWQVAVGARQLLRVRTPSSLESLSPQTTRTLQGSWDSEERWEDLPYSEQLALVDVDGRMVWTTNEPACQKVQPNHAPFCKDEEKLWERAPSHTAHRGGAGARVYPGPGGAAAGPIRFRGSTKLLGNMGEAAQLPGLRFYHLEKR